MLVTHGMKKSILITLIQCVVLSGCISDEQVRWERDNREMNECRRLGYNAYSESFANCRLQLRMIEAQEDQTKALRRSKNYHYRMAPLTEEYYKKCKVTQNGNTICKNW